MPLSSKEKGARHRARVNADPKARAIYLSKRKESYQRRKIEGKTKSTPIAELSKTKQEKLRQKWRKYQQDHRYKKRVLADEPVPTNVPAIKVEEPAVIQWSENSCFCARPSICKCHDPSPAEDLPSASTSRQQDLKGEFTLVRYESKSLVGQVIEVMGEEVEVNCMQQLGKKNIFTWPNPPDILRYYASDVLHQISEPEPLDSHRLKLVTDDWKQFQAHTACKCGCSVTQAQIKQE